MRLAAVSGAVEMYTKPENYVDAAGVYQFPNQDAVYCIPIDALKITSSHPQGLFSYFFPNAVPVANRKHLLEGEEEEEEGTSKRPRVEQPRSKRALESDDDAKGPSKKRCFAWKVNTYRTDENDEAIEQLKAAWAEEKKQLQATIDANARLVEENKDAVMRCGKLERLKKAGIKKFKTAISDFTERTAQWEAEKKDHEAQINELKARLEAEKQAFKEKEDHAVIVCARLLDEKRQLKAEKEALNTRCESTQQCVDDMTDEEEKLHNKIVALIEDKTGLEAKITELEAKKKDLAVELDTEKKVAAYQKGMKDFWMSYWCEAKDETKKLKAKIAELEAEKKGLATQLALSKSAHDDLSLRIADVLAAKEKVEVENKQLVERCSKLEQAKRLLVAHKERTNSLIRVIELDD